MVAEVVEVVEVVEMEAAVEESAVEESAGVVLLRQPRARVRSYGVEAARGVTTTGTGCVGGCREDVDVADGDEKALVAPSVPA